jgi:hypothetical protein
MRLKRLEGLSYYGLYFSFNDEGFVHPVWPWRFGWKSSQMYECFFFGPGYFCWGMGVRMT